MGGYVEKKRVYGKTYYYLTENKRVNGKWKKTRKYLGVHTPAGFEKPRKQKPKPALSQKELALVEEINRNYSKKHVVGKQLWNEERALLTSFVYNTNAIEGNALSLKETASVLAGEKIVAKPRDVLEVLNMKKCVDYLFDYRGELNEEFVLKLHEIEVKGILGDAGNYRNVDVMVGKYVCPSYEEVPQLMKRFFEWYRVAKKTMRVFELAALVHLKFVRIHPFRDGNGRVARLLMNFVLLSNKCPLLNIFNDEKLFYYLVLQEVDARKRSKPFVKYLQNVFVKQYQEYLQ
jgi:Fic family protein